MELAIRFGMMLEQTRPQVVVFDGTWPFQGFLTACRAYKRKLKLVWSNRGLLKKGGKEVPVDVSQFDLIIAPGELGAIYNETVLPGGGKKIIVPPVALLNDCELLNREDARHRLNMAPQERYVLFSLGSGNLKDVDGVGQKLIHRFQERGYRVVWACAPISVQDIKLPSTVMPVSVYPLVRYLKAFDAFVAAAGYNTCCEIVQTQIPSLLIPNTLLADDQARRAGIVAEHAPAVVSCCEAEEEIGGALQTLFQLVETHQPSLCTLSMDGATLVAEAIIGISTH